MWEPSKAWVTISMTGKAWNLTITLLLSNHNKLQNGGLGLGLVFIQVFTSAAENVVSFPKINVENMSKSRRGKSASANELSRWETELIQAPFSEVRTI